MDRGDLGVLPTDTGYGLGADAFNTEAVSRLLRAEGHGRHTPSPALVAFPYAGHHLVTDLPRAGIRPKRTRWAQEREHAHARKDPEPRQVPIPVGSTPCGQTPRPRGAMQAVTGQPCVGRRRFGPDVTSPVQADGPQARPSLMPARSPLPRTGVAGVRRWA
ncbi:Sua5/YciO/YrdC/YwlC family protein [Streptomyces lomondensis]|uniref:Sua5/YciO/YrdC/YwlC family protein n=1 Tax=Streptomyces lomondensis TaxID=68229 RepID=UPI003557760E